MRPALLVLDFKRKTARRYISLPVPPAKAPKFSADTVALDGNGLWGEPEARAQLESFRATGLVRE